MLNLASFDLIGTRKMFLREALFEVEFFIFIIQYINL